MDQWVWPAYIGVIGGVALFAVIFLPMLFWQVRRFGSLSLPRLIGAGALAVYIVALVAYTLLPLPAGDIAAWCAAHGTSGFQLRPGQFIEDIRAGTAGLGFTATVTSRAVLQVVFNVVLFMPLGMFVRRYLGRGVTVATAVALAVSALIEATQYTGVWGLFACSYRVADIDDLIANTLGGLLGALIAPLVMSWMPQSRELHGHRLTPRPITVWRRWASMLVDAVVYLALGAVLVAGWRMVLLGLGEPAPDDDRQWLEWALQFAVPWVAVFCVPALGRGASPGQRALWLTPVRGDHGASAAELPAPDVSESTRPGFRSRLARAWCVGGLWGVLQALQGLPVIDADRFGAADLLGLAAGIVALVAVLGVLLTRDHRGVSCLLTGTRIADVRDDGDGSSGGAGGGSAGGSGDGIVGIVGTEASAPDDGPMQTDRLRE